MIKLTYSNSIKLEGMTISEAEKNTETELYYYNHTRIERDEESVLLALFSNFQDGFDAIIENDVIKKIIRIQGTIYMNN